MREFFAIVALALCILAGALAGPAYVYTAALSYHSAAIAAAE